MSAYNTTRWTIIATRMGRFGDQLPSLKVGTIQVASSSTVIPVKDCKLEATRILGLSLAIVGHIRPNAARWLMRVRRKQNAVD
jgi:hypothetical protein